MRTDHPNLHALLLQVRASAVRRAPATTSGRTPRWAAAASSPARTRRASGSPPRIDASFHHLADRASRRGGRTRAAGRCRAHRPLPSMMMATCRGTSAVASYSCRRGSCHGCLLERVNREREGLPLPYTSMISASLCFSSSSTFSTYWLVSFCTSSCSRRDSSSESSPSFWRCLISSLASLRAWRSAIRASSVILWSSAHTRLRRSSVSAGIGHPDHLAVVGRVEPQIGGLDPLLDGTDHRFVPRLHHEHARPRARSRSPPG
jgi:hypothetical protein